MPSQTLVSTILGYVTGTLLPSITGAEYSYDLSGTGQVRVAGMRQQPELVPCVHVWIERCSSTHAGPATMRGYSRDLRIGFVGYVQPDDDTPGGRTLAAADLGDDIDRAVLDSARFDTGSTKLVQRVEVEWSALDGAEANAPAFGVVYGFLKIKAIREL